MTTVAAWIKHLRLHLDMTQAQFAERMNVRTPTAQRWEYGTSRPTGPAMTLMALIAEQSGFEPPPDQLQTTYGPRREG
jgi:DNA-binding transcriptional regulator YiaG